MARKQHSEDEVLRSFRNKNDLRIGSGTISVLSDKVYSKEKDCMVDNPKRKCDLGNGSWGKLDFLTKYCDYRLVYVLEFPQRDFDKRN